VKLVLEKFKGIVDIPDVKAFLVGRERWASLPDYWTTGKSTVGTYQAMFDSDPAHHIFWRDTDGEIQSYLWLYPQPIETVDADSNSWRMLIHPGQRIHELGAQIIKHAEKYLPSLVQEGDSSDSMRTVAYGKDFWLASLLTEFGYEREAAQEVYMLRSLQGAIEEPSLADGYCIRAFNPETDIVQRSGVQCDAFAGLVEPNDWSIENTCRFVQWSEGRNDLDLAAVNSLGEFASFALFLVDPITLVGELDPVGTRAAHRRKGLAKAVLLSGLKYLHKQGMKQAVVRTVVDNVSAIKLYESVGFRVVDKLYRYVKA
jgi:ribosomal protein S18 acetylase RimI-like enzyme